MAGAGTSANDHDLHPVALSICRRLMGLSLPSSCCIFAVPESLRQINEEAYTPRVVAIGPYHHGKPSLKPMEDHKLLYLRTFLEARVLNQKVISLDQLKDNEVVCLDRLKDDEVVHLKEYIHIVESYESNARSCYDKKIEFNSNRFTEMMLLDGIFVIQIFLMSRFIEMRMHSDPIFGRPWIFKDVCRDMTLLENQIPFFVIKGLFDKAFSRENWYSPTLLLELMYKFFSRHTQVEELLVGHRPSEVKHIVDALWLSFLPLINAAPHRRNVHFMFSPRATELVAAGVKLRRGMSKCFFDIEFVNGELRIPCLILCDTTESLFRNIIAFEQCYNKSNMNLISYMLFINQLVDTPADVELLIDKGIIKNWLSNKEAATDLINTLCKETTVGHGEYYFSGLSYELFKHCQRPTNKWKARFKRHYVLSTAVVLLLLTVVQTFCSVLSIALAF